MAKKAVKKKNAAKDGKSTKRPSRSKTSSSAARKKTGVKAGGTRKTAARKKTARADKGKDDMGAGMVTQKDQAVIYESGGVGAEVSRAASVPEFDLGKQMLAESRKTTSKRRRGPAGKIAAKESAEVTASVATDDSLASRIERASPQSPEKRQIITEIVQRDIERFRRANQDVV